MKVLLLLLSCFVSMNLYALGQQKEGIEPRYSAELEKLIREGKVLDQHVGKTSREDLLSSLAALLLSKDSKLRKKTLRYCLMKEYGDKRLLPFIYKTLKDEKAYPDGNEVYLSVLFMETYPDVRSIPILIELSNENLMRTTGFVETADGKLTRMPNREKIFPYIGKAVNKCSKGKIGNIPQKNSFGLEWTFDKADRNRFVAKWKKWWDEHGVIEMKKQNAAGDLAKESTNKSRPSNQSGQKEINKSSIIKNKEQDKAGAVTRESVIDNAVDSKAPANISDTGTTFNTLMIICAGVVILLITGLLVVFLRKKNISS